MSGVVPMVVDREGGESLWFGGGLVTLKVTSAQSGGAYLLIEHRARRGKTTPLHLHPEHDEVGYLLEGELLLHLDGVERAVGPGGVVSIPRGTPHALLVASETARSVWVVTPGGPMEEFFRGAGDQAPGGTLPPPGIDVPRLLAVGERTGAMRVLGPPPFAAAGRL